MFGKTICSAVLAASVSLGGIASAAAAPLRAQAPAVQQDLVVKIDQRRGYYKRNGVHYYNGYRGSRHHRPGYRQHNGFWFPAAAFALGFFLAPQIQQGRTIQLTPAHYRWCDDHYKSYRRYDNTFQPYHGPRKQCASPYMR